MELLTIVDEAVLALTHLDAVTLDQLEQRAHFLESFNYAKLMSLKRPVASMVAQRIEILAESVARSGANLVALRGDAAYSPSVATSPSLFDRLGLYEEMSPTDKTYQAGRKIGIA